ncbi:sigma-70 family RNA polymerase sigma factor [Bowmanella sp. JS7-9]|uniref:Sigma-70 family RNA polymerase sigma factor n=1 Tax=Pseudobowmanella zhangzhouensis TaxID=1537679 RepID=A0ABW1XMR1_9ALTE|nr:sigma-70 family RNA polymerase sigma factor [Bowmanella sp. JS7-9]
MSTHFAVEPALEMLLIAIAQQRDQAAFRQLFNAVGGRLKGYAVKSGANDKDADELVQETMLLVWRKAHLYDPTQASALTWLFTLLRNKRVDLLRRNKHNLISADDLYLEPESAQSEHDAEPLQQEIESDRNQHIVRNLLQHLPTEQRIILYKVYFEGKSHSEISDELALPLGTVKSRLRLALSKFEVLARQHFLWLLIIQMTNY